jgi:predicted metalloprotease with PDZ domain
MDSPSEFGPVSMRQFTVGPRTFRFALHHTGTDAELDGYVKDVEKIVRQEGAIYGEYPEYEPGYYTFLADYLPYANSDGMEHRNSTVMSAAGSIASSRENLLDTVAHEFFHCWNVERIRPQGLEPFNFEEANMTDSLWLAEGFTQYYGSLIMGRAGLSDRTQTIASFGQLANWVVNGSGRQVRSAVDMSRMAPFVDAARAVDRTNFSTTFISYYTYGGAIALGLDLTLRDKTGGKVTLDDFMRSMWRTYGRPGGPEPGLVAKPYSLTDIRDRLAEVTGDRAFADDYFTHYMAGRDVVDYSRLFGLAGIVLRKRNEGRAWIGNLRLDSQSGRIVELVAPRTPAYAAGLEQDDVITAIDGKPVATAQQIQEVLRAHKPGDQIRVAFTRRSGPATATIALEEDPELEALPLEAAGGTPTPEQKAFRDRWLASQQR